ncbi:MAG: hypothetical protein OEZ39_15260 [Gammaproteobacteria bacterium]|nr:hypothetical protein [Gammaproteobacteria bacterium]MDH5653213.1 hypothetical protein [Gammaproteobacteria bacterium]
MKATLLSILALTAMVTACSNNSQTQTTFQHLRLIHYAKDFPRSAASLERCKKYHDQPCLNNYALAKSAKQKLFDTSRAEAFAATLQVIQQACATTDADINNLCPGGVTALAFFSSAEEDAQIRQFLANLTPATLQNIFSMNRHWLVYRHDAEKWKSWLNSTGLGSETKQEITNLLNEKNPDKWLAEIF